MSAVEALSIVLQHDIDEQYQYQPGEIIRGTIQVTLNKVTSIKEIMVKVYGEGNVSWKDPSGQVFQAQEIYVDASKPVLDTTYDTERPKFNPGTHEFPFDYIIPDNVPSSYIGKFGNVTYAMKVTVSCASSRDTAISSEPFLVLRRAPIPKPAQQALAMTASKRMLCSCSFGTLDIRVSIDRAGGVPGEDIFLQAEIKNQSGRPVTALQASLLMTSLFRAQTQSKDFRQVVSKKRDEGEVSPGEGRRWTQVRLPLPPYVPESKLEYCDIIELDYVFQFRVELTGGDDILLEAPFWVGAQPQGLEVPENERQTMKINRQWTVRGSQHLAAALAEQNALSEDGDGRTNGFGPNGEMSNRPPEPIEDYNEGWGVGLVPELRRESSTVINPLFQDIPDHIARGVKVIPDELIETTRL